MPNFQKRVNFLINFDSKKTLNENNFLFEDSLSGKPKTKIYSFKPKQSSIQDKTYVKEPTNVEILRTRGVEYLKSWLEQANLDELSKYTLYLKPQPPKQIETTIIPSGWDVTKTEGIKWALPYDSSRAQISICVGRGVRNTTLTKGIYEVCNCGESNKYSDYIYRSDDAGSDFGKFVKKPGLNNKIDYWTKEEDTKTFSDNLSPNLKNSSNLETKTGESIGTPNCLGKQGYDFLFEIYTQDLNDWNSNYKFYEDLQSLILITAIITAIATGGLSGLLYGGLVDLAAVKVKMDQAKSESNPYLKRENELEAGILLAWAFLPPTIWAAGGLSKTIVGGLIRKILKGVKLDGPDRLLRLKVLRLLRGADRDILLNFTKSRFRYFLSRPGKLGLLSLFISLKLTVKSWKIGFTLGIVGGAFVTIQQLGNWLGINLFGADKDMGPLKKIPKTEKNMDNIFEDLKNQQIPKKTKEVIYSELKNWDEERLKNLNKRLEGILGNENQVLEKYGKESFDTTGVRLDVDLSDLELK